MFMLRQVEVNVIHKMLGSQIAEHNLNLEILRKSSLIAGIQNNALFLCLDRGSRE